MAHHWSSRELGLRRDRRIESDSPVGTGVVVVIDVLGHDGAEVPLAKDQHPVQYLSPGTLYPALGHGVRLGSSRGRLHNPHPFAPEDLVEVRGELRIAVPNQDGGPATAIPDVPGEVTSLLSDPPAVGLAVHPAKKTRRVESSMKKNTYNRRRKTVSTVKKSQARTAPA